MPAIMNIAAKHDLKVLSKIAHWRSAPMSAASHAGLFGDAGTFSFYPVKHITTGDGGMLITRHADLAQKIGKARFGVDRTVPERKVPGVYDVLSLGINYRLSDINSAIGREQLKRLDQILERRARNFARLKAGLAGLDHVSVLDVTSPNHDQQPLLPDGGARWAAGRTSASRSSSASMPLALAPASYYPHPIPRLVYYREKYSEDLSRFPNAARDQRISRSRCRSVRTSATTIWTTSRRK